MDQSIDLIFGPAKFARRGKNAAREALALPLLGWRGGAIRCRRARALRGEFASKRKVQLDEVALIDEPELELLVTADGRDRVSMAHAFSGRWHLRRG